MVEKRSSWWTEKPMFPIGEIISQLGAAPYG